MWRTKHKITMLQRGLESSKYIMNERRHDQWYQTFGFREDLAKKTDKIGKIIIDGMLTIVSVVVVFAVSGLVKT